MPFTSLISNLQRFISFFVQLTSMGAGVTKERLYVKLVKLPNAAPDGEEAVEVSALCKLVEDFTLWKTL